MVMLGSPCSPCCAGPAPLPALCGCVNQATLQSLDQSVYTMSFSVSAANARVIPPFSGPTSLPACDAQFGFAGSTMAQQAAWIQSWANYFNSLVVTMTRGTTVGFDYGPFWKGGTPWTTTPAGGLAKHLYVVNYSCPTNRTRLDPDYSSISYISGMKDCVTAGPYCYTPNLFRGSWLNHFTLTRFDCGEIIDIGTQTITDQYPAGVMCSTSPRTDDNQPYTGLCRRPVDSYWRLEFTKVTATAFLTWNPLP